MAATQDEILKVLERLELPDGGNLVSRDMVRALTVDGNQVRFVIEAADPGMARQMEGLRMAAERGVESLAGVTKCTVALTAHGPAPAKEPPQLKIGGHPQPQKGRITLPDVNKIIAIGSGKGGVGKSTVSSNLAVALAKQGLKVGLLDADIYGPSQPRMMGVNRVPASSDGKTMLPLEAHSVKLMSIGFLVDADKAVVWRGPMLAGALQQFLTKVEWGELDVLLIDMPPGTGDVQLTLGQKAEISGAIVVSTPQDVALLDARKALHMFEALKTPVLGLIENMSTYVCPKCGHEAHLFGHGGVAKEAETLDLPLLAALPIDLETRLAGDAGRPVALGEGSMADAYEQLAKRMMDDGLV